MVPSDKKRDLLASLHVSSIAAITMSWPHHLNPHLRHLLQILFPGRVIGVTAFCCVEQEVACLLHSTTGA